MSVQKIGVLVLWAVLACAFLLPDESVGGKIGRIAFWVTAAAHVVEFVIYRPTLRRAEGSMGHHFLQVLVFGVFHYKEVQEELGEADKI